LFLGVRLDCAHCHNHPFEQITLGDNLGMAAFFARVRRKRPPVPMANNDVIVYLARSGSIRHPETKQVVQPKFLKGLVLEEAESIDPRAALADWITSPDNPYFARNMVNRVWYWLMGRGIVHEPDDFRSTNPPSNPELLDYLADEFVQSGYDMKHIFRLVLASRTYQLSSRPNRWNQDDRIHFSHYPIRRLDAEQMLDALSAATGAPDKFPGLPPCTRAAQLPDAYVRSVMLDLFGRPMRATACECERSNEMHIGQTLHLMSSEHVEGKLVSAGARLSQLLASDLSDEAIVEELYLACLSRLATDEEKKTIFADPIPPDRRREWFEDLLWTLANTKEFLFNH